MRPCGYRGHEATEMRLASIACAEGGPCGLSPNVASRSFRWQERIMGRTTRVLAAAALPTPLPTCPAAQPGAASATAREAVPSGRSRSVGPCKALRSAGRWTQGRQDRRVAGSRVLGQDAGTGRPGLGAAGRIGTRQRQPGTWRILKLHEQRGPVPRLTGSAGEVAAFTTLNWAWRQLAVVPYRSGVGNPGKITPAWPIWSCNFSKMPRDCSR